MNWVDLLILIVLLFFVYESIGSFFIAEALDLLSFVFSFSLALSFYNTISSRLENIFSLPHSLANVLGFILIWYVSETILFLVIRIFFKRLKKNPLLPLDNFLRFIQSLFKGLIFISVILILIATFPIQPQIKESVHQSKIGSAILLKSYGLEAPLKNVFGGLANDSLAFLTIKPQSNERISTGYRTDKFYFDEKLENQMIDLVNKERVNNGLPPLIFDERLREVGRMHSADMFKQGYFSHYSPDEKNVADRAEDAGIQYLVIGENLAYAPSLQLAHNGLMNSPGHKANILSPEYHRIGIGIANGGDYGIMFTQVFMN